MARFQFSFRICSVGYFTVFKIIII